MKKILLLTLVLALAAVALAAAQTSPSQSPVPAPAPLTPAVNAQSSAAVALPNALQGALFASDWECEQACFDDYIQCSNGCSACDQCSCQLAYCRVSCGVPFQGC